MAASSPYGCTKGATRHAGCSNCLEEAGVTGDWREPDVIRVAPVPLYNSYTDVFRFVEILEGLVTHDEEPPVTLLGAGLAGSLLAVFLARRGHEVVVYERLPDMRRHAIPAGRSINLALAHRGIRPLQAVGLMPEVQKLLIPMRGRMLHDKSGGLEPRALWPHPQRSDPFRLPARPQHAAHGCGGEGRRAFPFRPAGAQTWTSTRVTSAWWKSRAGAVTASTPPP